MFRMKKRKTKVLILPVDPYENWPSELGDPTYRMWNGIACVCPDYRHLCRVHNQWVTEPK